MINVFFAPGMFGSTVEFMIRNFTKEFKPVTGKILDDGSMHSFKKRFHYHPQGLKKLFETFNNDIDITTILYPDEDHKFNWIIENWPGKLIESKNILITAHDKNDAELNLLFRNYKMAQGFLNLGLDIFFKHINFNKWNKNINHWSELETWELRECFSLYYSRYISEFIENNCSTIPNVKVIRNTDFLSDPFKEFSNIIDHCHLSQNSNNIENFVHEWLSKQQYILDEFILIKKIVDHTLQQRNFDWSNSRLCLISEAIIQHRLREQGFEIKCWNLNSFPTNTETLTNILEKI